MRLVVDASVAIKWLVPEADSTHALEIASAYDLVAPQLIYAECTTIVWKKVRRGELTTEEAQEAAMFIDTFFVRTVAMKELVPVALDLSLNLDHSAHDCFYFALAMLKDCRLVTADRKLRGRSAETLGETEAQRCLLLGVPQRSSRNFHNRSYSMNPVRLATLS